MSLRDQLVSKGFASKKDARRINQKMKKNRKSSQGSRRRAKKVERERQAAEAKEREAKLQERLAERKERDAARAAFEHEQRVRQIILGNRLTSAGTCVFHHRTADGKRLRRMCVDDRVAWKLRAGTLAIAALPFGGDVEYVLVSNRAASKLVEIEPGALVFWNRDTDGLSAPDLDFVYLSDDISLRPHRATDEDLARFLAAPE